MFIKRRRQISISLKLTGVYGKLLKKRSLKPTKAIVFPIHILYTKEENAKKVEVEVEVEVKFST